MHFENFPRLLRSLFVGAYGYRNGFLRYGAEFRRFSSFLEATDRSDREEWEAYQARELVTLLETVGLTTPALRGISLRLDDFRDAPDPYALLAELPLQEKAEMRARPQDFVNTALKAVMTSSTSGSTGSPMKFGHDDIGLQRRIALMKDHFRLAGLGARPRSLRLSGRIISNPEKRDPKPWLANPAENQIFLSTYHLNEAHAAFISCMAHSFDPELIDGYPSAILEFLRLVAAKENPLRSLRAVITTAETLDDPMRAEIEELSGAKVLDYYAASEGVHPIQQCAFGTYHVRWQGGVFEVSTEEGVAPEGDGELICSSFLQRKTPLVRYRTGDLVRGYSREGTPCPCGLHTPTATGVLGRVEDQVKTRDGRRIGMFPYRTLKLIDGVESSQIIQKGYDDFEVLAVILKKDNVSNIYVEIKDSFERVLGYPVNLEVVSVESIPKGPNGKVRSVIMRF